jgi:cob(I)alamin adenosyltransferase
VELSKTQEINKDAAIYLNRLSDLIFVLARTVNNRKKIADITWKP